MTNLNFRAMIGHKMGYFNFADIYNGTLKTSHSLPTLDSVMQSTGLKDTNNKEIFGGDLIKTPFDELMKVEFFPSISGFACAYLDENNSHTLFFDELDNIMIIGNIHENPELLI